MALDMNFGMHQRQQQRLMMTAQMIQSIEMLQLPLMALEQTINQQLSENPMLEIDEKERENTLGEAEQLERETRDEYERLSELSRDEDWEDSLISSKSMHSSRGEEDPKLSAMMNTPSRPVTLQEHIIEQIHLSDASKRIAAIAEVLAYELDDNGYLLHDAADVFRTREEDEELGVVTPEEANEAASLIRTLEPIGVGARSIEECLLIQLRHLIKTELADKIANRGPRAKKMVEQHVEISFEEILITNHFDDLLHNRLPKVATATERSIEDIKQAMAKIAKLNPRPGQEFAQDTAQYVAPDVIIEQLEDDYTIRMNDSLPPLKVSEVYSNIMNNEKRGSQAKRFLRDRMQSARWLIDSIEQRRTTLVKITKEIVDAQRSFLENGVSDLKPLMMQDVAERIGMHVSTVSRAIAEKYIETPQGLYPMRYFFTGGYTKKDDNATGAAGADISNRSVMNKIQEIVDAEDKKKPLSDEAIVKALLKEDIKIARRTVAKYREKLGIVGSRGRKQY